MSDKRPRATRRLLQHPGVLGAIHTPTSLLEGESPFRVLQWPSPRPSIPACRAHNETLTIIAHITKHVPLSWNETQHTPLDRAAGDCYSKDDQVRTLSKNHFGDMQARAAVRFGTPIPPFLAWTV